MNKGCLFIWILGLVIFNAPVLLADTGLVPGSKSVFKIPLSRSEIRWIKSSGLSGYRDAEVAVAVPESFDSEAFYPILVTCVTGDRYLSNIEEMDKYWPQAIQKDWIVVTGWADPHPVRDTKAYRRALASAALRKLAELLPESTNWPVAVAGFSGGAKNTSVTAAYLQKDGYRIIGLFMGGCNQDLATYSMKKISPDKKAFSRIPIFLSNGTEDKVSTIEQSRAVATSLSNSGFQQVRFETYPGKHYLNRNHVSIALDWFARLANPQ